MPLAIEITCGLLTSVLAIDEHRSGGIHIAVVGRGLQMEDGAHDVIDLDIFKGFDHLALLDILTVCNEDGAHRWQLIVVAMPAAQVIHLPLSLHIGKALAIRYDPAFVR